LRLPVSCWGWGVPVRKRPPPNGRLGDTSLSDASFRQHRRRPNPTAIERDAHEDGTILELLLSETSHRPWSVDEIAREMGRDVAASLKPLYGGGLVHRLDGFVWATRAAAMADEIRA
jgi:hypothetical protein